MCSPCNDPDDPRWYQCDVDGGCSFAVRLFVYGWGVLALTVLLFVTYFAVDMWRAAGILRRPADDGDRPLIVPAPMTDYAQH